MTKQQEREAGSACPHCHSGNDPVLKDTTWSCGVRFNDALWRTKECYRRNLESANDRIKELEREIDRLNMRILSLEVAGQNVVVQATEMWKRGAIKEWLDLVRKEEAK